MNSKYKYLIKSTGVLTISSFSTKLISFFLVPLYTAILTTEDYGIISLISTTISLLIPFLTLNILDAVVVFSIRNKNFEAVIRIVLRYLAASFPGMGIILILNNAFNIFALNNLELYIFILFAATISNEFFNEFAKATEHINDIAFAGFISSLVVIIFNILFVLYLKLGIKGYLSANILGIGSSVLYLIIRLKIWNYFSVAFDSKMNKEMIRYAFPLIATTIGWIINSAGDKYVSAYFLGAGVTGLISVAYKLPSIISIFNGIFSRSWQVSAVKEYQDTENNFFYANVFVYLNFFLVFIGSCLIAGDKILARFLFLKDFFNAWNLVPFLIISSILEFVAGFMGPILAARLDNKTLAKSTIYSSILNIGLNIILCLLMGAIGLTIATMLSSLFIYVYRRRVIGKLIAGYDIIIYTSWICLIFQAVMRIYSSVEILSWLPMVAILFLYKNQIRYVFNKIKKTK